MGRALANDAGIAAAGRGKPGAWRVQRGQIRDELFRQSHDAIVDEAVRASPPFLYLAAPNEFEFSDDKVVTVLNERDEPTDEFLSALAEAFGLGAGWGDSDGRSRHRVNGSNLVG